MKNRKFFKMFISWFLNKKRPGSRCFDFSNDFWSMLLLLARKQQLFNGALCICCDYYLLFLVQFII